MERESRQYEDLANRVSSLGRGPDTTMIHVAPLELEVLDQMTPGGLSTNPHTGKKEALWWFAPLLGAVLGGTMGGITAKKRDIPLWKGILMGAGTGAVSGAVTGGLGSVMSPTAQVSTELVKEGVVQAGTELAKGAVVESAKSLGENVALESAKNLGQNIAPEVLSSAQMASLEGGIGQFANPLASTPYTPPVGASSLGNSVTESLQVATGNAGQVSSPVASEFGSTLGGEEFLTQADATTYAGSAPQVSTLDPAQALQLEEMVNPAQSFGEQMGQGLGEYARNPMHAIAALGATEQVLPKYKEDNPWGDAFDTGDYDPYWEDEVGGYDHSSGPYWS